MKAATKFYSPRVRDLMTANPVTLTEEDNLKSLRDLMQAMSIRHVPVVDVEGKVQGLITHRDFLTVAVSKLAHLKDSELDEIYSGIRLKEVMGRKVATTRPDVSLAEVAEIMVSNKYGCLPVTAEDGSLLGILTEADFLKAFLEREARFA